jgi:hypothetical protein
MVTKGPCGGLSCFMKCPTFIKISGDHFYNEVTLKKKSCMQNK